MIAPPAKEIIQVCKKGMKCFFYFYNSPAKTTFSDLLETVRRMFGAIGSMTLLMVLQDSGCHASRLD
jgi:hypothetical protein